MPRRWNRTRIAYEPNDDANDAANAAPAAAAAAGVGPESPLRAAFSPDFTTSRVPDDVVDQRRSHDSGSGAPTSVQQDGSEAGSTGEPTATLKGVRLSRQVAELAVHWFRRDTEMGTLDLRLHSAGAPARGYRGASEQEMASSSLGARSRPSAEACALSLYTQQLESRVGRQGVQRARRDQHSRRKPIPCGVPLLTGHSCDYACHYCYIQDWYVFTPPTPSPLSGDEVVLALLYNASWRPGWDFIILGDVCDPFHANLQARTMEYIAAAAPLRSPLQFCTKSLISESNASELARIAREHHCPIQPLVTITTLAHAAKVEPRAPSVEQRLETVRRLAAEGLPVFVFMRPLLPGASADFRDVLRAAKQAGAVGVIAGSLRVSKKIYRRIQRVKAIDIEEIDRQLRAAGVEPEDLNEQQVDIQDEPVRAALCEEASKLGLAYVRRACCANAWAAGWPCNKPNCLMRKAPLMKDLLDW
eukprot:TRINITY_DN21693_c0_g1_i1.p1 TRINITY_DN21693_c0_g1~~TRINITY_DN21693_c0_g1_i1.p1  ORF type:complete len:474 (-),score=68.58 TRINITY_DN21693_c0_g1_i1:454-1875(-)